MKTMFLSVTVLVMSLMAASAEAVQTLYVHASCSWNEIKTTTNQLVTGNGCKLHLVVQQGIKLFDKGHINSYTDLEDHPWYMSIAFTSSVSTPNPDLPYKLWWLVVPNSRTVQELNNTSKYWMLPASAGAQGSFPKRTSPNIKHHYSNTPITWNDLIPVN